MNCYFCDACHYCFTAEQLPERCPDCGKLTAYGHPAVRIATEAEFDLFSNVEKQEKEKTLQKALLGIKKKYGKNAILKGTNFLDGATMRERNKQIGGHKES